MLSHMTGRLEPQDTTRGDKTRRDEVEGVATHPLLKVLSLVYREHRDKWWGWLYRPKHKPWMRYREIEVVEQILQRLQPTSCLEWGAGHSTLFFPRRLSQRAQWVTIEHEAEWAKKIRDLGPSAAVSIHCVPPNQFPWTDEHQDGGYADLADYIEYPERFAPYDFVLVDGRARKHCVQKAFELIEPDGIVILHDANRKYYHEPLEQYPHQVLLLGYRKTAGGLWIGSWKTPIDQVLDVQRHQAIWRLCRKVGRILRC